MEEVKAVRSLACVSMLSGRAAARMLGQVDAGDAVWLKAPARVDLAPPCEKGRRGTSLDPSATSECASDECLPLSWSRSQSGCLDDRGSRMEWTVEVE